MSQHDGVIDNAAGAPFRTDLNGALMALLTLSSGASAPSTTFAYMWWADTANTLLKQRNAANSAWITVGTLDATNLGLLALTGGTLTGALTMSGKPVNFAKGASVASGSTADIWTPSDGNIVHLTGTSAIASFGTAPQAGAWRVCIADAACSLTHGANLVCPGGANITLAAGDLFFVIADTTTTHRVLGPLFASGAPTSFLRDDAVTLAKIGHGTRGGLIHFAGASGVPTDSGAGTDGYVWTSAGPGADAGWEALPSSGGTTLVAAVATTSGTEKDFGSIPAGTRKISIMLSGVSLDSTDELAIQIGDAGGIESAGYAWHMTQGTATANGSSDDRWEINRNMTAGEAWTGVVELTLMNAATNLWMIRGVIAANGIAACITVGTKALSAELTTVRITSSDNDSFDAGSVSISYQG